MTCRELIQFLMEYLDGELPAHLVRRFEEHLAICPDCRAYLHNYQQTVKAGKAALSDCGEDIPEAVPEELVRAILEVRRKAAM
jgi:anti-sigma factor RsiW